MVILQGLEIALFTLFSIKVLYLFVFSVASRSPCSENRKERRETRYAQDRDFDTGL